MVLFCVFKREPFLINWNQEPLNLFSILFFSLSQPLDSIYLFFSVVWHLDYRSFLLKIPCDCRTLKVLALWERRNDPLWSLLLPSYSRESHIETPWIRWRITGNTCNKKDLPSPCPDLVINMGKTGAAKRIDLSLPAAAPIKKRQTGSN